MRIYRMIFCWTCAFASAACIWLACDLVQDIVRIHASSLPPRSLLGGASFVALFVVLPLLAAAIFGAAWWSLWKQKPRAKEWGIAASTILFLIWTPMIYFGWRIYFGFERWAWYVPAIGALGLIEFLWASKKPELNVPPHE